MQKFCLQSDKSVLNFVTLDKNSKISVGGLDDIISMSYFCSKCVDDVNNDVSEIAQTETLVTIHRIWLPHNLFHKTRRNEGKNRIWI